MPGSAIWIKRLFLRDKGLKCLSLVLAMLAWYGIRGTVDSRGPDHSVPTVAVGDKTRREAGIAVSAMFVPDPAWRVELWPSKVNVVLTGGSSELRKVSRADIRAVVDCCGMTGIGAEKLPVTNDLPVVVSVTGGTDVAGDTEPATVRAVIRPAR